MKRTIYLAIAAILTLTLGTSPPEVAAAPKKLTRCQAITQAGSYVLDRHLTAIGDCFVVSSPFVTIDLNGFAIIGNGTGSGITSPGRAGTVVRNGTISGFANGIVLDGFRTSHIERMNVVGNAGGGIFVGEDSIVTGNTVLNNGASGIILNGRSTVLGNTASGNGNAGILDLAPGSTISGNTARGNADGINVACPSNVLGNTATDNTGTNLVLNGAGCNNANNVAP